MDGRTRARITHVTGTAVLALAVVSTAPAFAQQTNAPLDLCVGCHAPGMAPAAPIFPSLSGQHAEYLVKQLRDYKRGRRLSPIMVPPLATVAERDIVPLATFFARQRPLPGREPGDAALAERGRAIYHSGLPGSGVANCAGCHEADGSGGGRYPRLAGFEPAYVEQELMDFRSGVRHNDPARVMRVVAAGMTDDDIRAVAEYIVGLRSGQ